MGKIYPYINMAEAAALCKRQKSHIQKLVADGTLAYFQIGKAWRTTLSNLLLAEGLRKPENLPGWKDVNLVELKSGIFADDGTETYTTIPLTDLAKLWYMDARTVLFAAREHAEEWGLEQRGMRRFLDWTKVSAWLSKEFGFVDE